jgi:hypothetical protein
MQGVSTDELSLNGRMERQRMEKVNTIKRDRGSEIVAQQNNSGLDAQGSDA